jgi:hypothetical protein
VLLICGAMSMAGRLPSAIEEVLRHRTPFGRAVRVTAGGSPSRQHHSA